MRPVPLSPHARQAALDAMEAAPLDVLVIGGGVVGAGAAQDAATRGLSVGLVEARDFASGTSSRSSKLMHGGLRYLEMLDFRLVAEALKERGLNLQKLAPHLVQEVAFLYPLQHRGWERFYAGSGVALYDAMSKASGYGKGVPLHRHHTRRGARKIFPGLRKDALVGALRYYDAQVDDARHTMFLARTSAAYGAHVASRTRVVDLLREGLLPAFPIRTGPIPFYFEVTFARLPISVFARTAASVVPASADRGAPFFKKFFGRK